MLTRPPGFDNLVRTPNHAHSLYELALHGHHTHHNGRGRMPTITPAPLQRYVQGIHFWGSGPSNPDQQPTCVLWFAVSFLLVLAFLVWGKEASREWGIGRVGKQQRRGDANAENKADREEKRGDEKQDWKKGKRREKWEMRNEKEEKKAKERGDMSREGGEEGSQESRTWGEASLAAEEPGEEGNERDRIAGTKRNEHQRQTS